MDIIAELTAPPRFRSISAAAQHRLLVVALLAGDALALAAAFALAYGLRFFSGLPFFVAVEPTVTWHVEPAVALLPLWLVLFALAGLYAEHNLLGGTREYALVFNACTAGTVLVVAANFFSAAFLISRGWLMLAWLFSFLLVCGYRFGLRRAVYRLRRQGYFLAPAVIAGAGQEGQALAQQLQAWETSGLRLVGFVDDGRPAGTPVFNGFAVLGSLADVPALVARYGVEEVIVASSEVPRGSLVELTRTYALSDRLKIRLSSGLFEILTTGVHFKEIGQVPLIGLNKVRLNGIEVVLKTALDYAIALPGLVLISPLLLAIALAVKLDSPGPVFYRRRVMGRSGRPFDAFKFRTMRTDGDAILAAHPELQAELAHNYKLKDDPRVTRLGAFLRKWSLDELPQLLNVLARQMSLVGPRMISAAELEEYGKWDMNLLTVWPGITGLWQISGRSDVTYDERVRLDMHYIRNYTIWLDLQILLRTVPAVLKGKGAY
jgi:exopolysaccharide biosynthesis polyprenyl glycosylphosphotransferase